MACLRNEPNCPTNPPSPYYISTKDFNDDKDLSLALATGVLAVPFKFHFTDHAVTAGSTLGAYVGFQQNLSFTELSEVIGGGLALVSSTSATSNYTC